MKLIDLTGKKFNSLEAICRSSDVNGKVAWLCKCDCGNEKIILSDHLTRKRQPVKSCGCIRNRRGPEHKDWKGAGEISGGWWADHVNRSRRGHAVEMTIQDGWDKFVQQDRKCALTDLLLVMGTDASLDRIDSAGPYSVENTQWVHKEVNLMKNVLSQDRFVELCRLVSGVCEVPLVRELVVA